MVTANLDLKSTTGLRYVRALCSCLGTNITTLRMVKAGNLVDAKPIVTISHMAKTVSQRSVTLDALIDYNLVVCTQAEHYKNKAAVRYTYTVTGFGLSVLSELFGVQFYLINHR